mmetsp:Transcript_1640/g.3528  ORF Transcript_1640/g.3528 Transcript_1640/m.3528 type:complete len:431 (+) Transcript_1640:467-1759(+)
MVARDALKSCIASFFLTSASASFFSWGMVNLYIVSYFRLHDPDASVNKAFWAYCFGLISFGFSESLSPFVCERIGTKKTVLMGGGMLFVGYVLCALSTSMNMFIFAFSFVVGGGCGFCFITGINVVARHFDVHRGKAIGVGSSGYGAGYMGISLLYGLFCNPTNEVPSVVEEGSDIKYFGADVANNVPYALVIMAFACLTLVLIGTILISPKPLPTKDEEVELLSLNSETEESVFDVLKTALFWKMYVLLNIGFFSCLWINVSFKNFGSIYIKDDHLLTYIGFTGATAACFSRAAFPFLIDYFDFFKVNMGALIAIAIVDFSIYYAVASPHLFTCCVVVTLVCMGSQFFPFAILCMKIYGTTKGPKVFSFLSWATTSCGLIATLYYDLVGVIGFGWSYWLQGFLILVGLCISNSLRLQFSNPIKLPNEDK